MFAIANSPAKRFVIAVRGKGNQFSSGPSGATPPAAPCLMTHSSHAPHLTRPVYAAVCMDPKT